MRLAELVQGMTGVTIAAGDAATEIRALAADSREVEPGALFAALPGATADGRAFVADALNRGAAAVLAPEGTTLPAEAKETALVTTDAPRQTLARMAARFFTRQPATIAAVTGTNGKTSVASFTRQLWAQHGDTAASLGTLGLVPEHLATSPGALTTPDPVALHRCLAELAGAGCDHLAIEASSHGLDQGRLDGLTVTAAAFTNLSQDHLDYHADMAGYWAAKRRLFTELLPAGGTAVINADAPEAGELLDICQARGLRALTYGTYADNGSQHSGSHGGAELLIQDREPGPAGQQLGLRLAGERHDVHLPLVGSFQATNALAALGLAVAGGMPIADAVAGLAKLEGVPGRLQRVAQTPGGGQVVVDYAHAPGALETVLTALHPHAHGRLVVVVGCGGDRDRGKRPQMGAIAERLADRVIVTDDNPRSEDAAAIRRAVLAGAPGAREIGDRGEAIRTAVSELEPGDVLLIAGKGHETGQVVGERTLPFDDAAVARAAVAAQAAGGRAQ
ncbi:UDP-N-acetylmuramoylalanyl-D-glutamate--2,6-diaminopimelate ligase [Limimonas halophila]|uniref:UDP-N-acetylmuramoyl-L-alanyl-D-glutamate--2,6-diaminopimelate ligase n=1 Tax=Limimonas halophila TaxID=1082479 RepID=A0A1G7U763_9PROT|nr:UDP-N-acetylmuramoyl-L-alanyl-D-glutamate--2,6-diaminopimelate ligase [Limimonas halophila]SDG42889.1 UDP-N-acetylmuramoylalanyl-D-glutamate--2,6-diaminopimelate ligase [Limimonas halophila]